MTAVLQVYEQDPAETLDYSAEFSGHCSRLREPDTDYATGTRVRPARANGFQYNASTGGRTGTNEPRWPASIGATVQDGSVTWTCEAISDASLKRTVTTAAWTADAGITVGTTATAGTKSTALLSGGTLGQRYLIRCTATCSDNTTPTVAFCIAFQRPARVIDV